MKAVGRVIRADAVVDLLGCQLTLSLGRKVPTEIVEERSLRYHRGLGLDYRLSPLSTPGAGAKIPRSLVAVSLYHQTTTNELPFR